MACLLLVPTWSLKDSVVLQYPVHLTGRSASYFCLHQNATAALNRLMGYYHRVRYFRVPQNKPDKLRSTCVISIGLDGARVDLDRHLNGIRMPHGSRTI